MGVMRPIKINKRRKNQGGFSLVFALIGISIIGTVMAVNIQLNGEQVAHERAVQTAWLVDQISQAARLYVRDQSVTNAPLWGRDALCPAPREILVADLVPNYLSANIGMRRDATNTRFMTPLDQTVRVMAANSVIDSTNCTAAALNGVAPTAYVLLEPGPRANQGAILSLAEALSEKDLPVIAPQFSAAGVNTSPACGAGPGTVQWDTGCLTVAQYNFLHPSGAFAQGHFGLPVWLTFRGDNRAIFRYPQPENPLAQTMTTDLRMAAALHADTTCTTAEQIQIRTSDSALAATDPTATAVVPSGVCGVQNDFAGNNKRNDIVGLGDIIMERAIITPQSTDVDVTGAMLAENTPVVSITGDVTVNGNVRSFNNTTSDVLHTMTDSASKGPTSFSSGLTNLYGSPSITVAERRAGTTALPKLYAGTRLYASDIQADSGAVLLNTGVVGPTTVSNSLTSNGSVTLSDTGGAGRGLVASRISGSAPSLQVDGKAAVFGITQVAGPTNIAGTGSTLALATARLDAGSIDMASNSNVTIGGDFTTGGSADIGLSANPGIASVGTCYGVCPDRQVVTNPDLGY